MIPLGQEIENDVAERSDSVSHEVVVRCQLGLQLSEGSTLVEGSAFKVAHSR